MSGQLRLNYFSGTAEFYEAEIRGAFIDALGQEEGEVWAREFVMLLRDDFAVLQRPEQSGDIGVVVPWRLLVQPARPEILSPMLLTEFGIGPNMTPVTTRAVMTQRFHNVPASVLDEQNLEKLSQIAMFGMLRSLSGRWKETLDDIDSAFTVTIKSGGGPTGTVPSGSVVVDVANQALACLSNARITLHWWGT